MGNIKINSHTLSFTLVPDYIIESLIKNMSSNSIKVVLVLLNLVKKNEDISTEKISNISGILEEYVYESLTELNEYGLIRTTNSNQLEFELVWDNNKLSWENDDNEALEEKNNISNNLEKASNLDNEKSSNTLVDTSFQELAQEVEIMMGTTLNPSMNRLLISLREDFNFPDEVILMLVNHCVQKRKTNVKYMEQIAINWKEKGINTLDEVNSAIKDYEEKWIKYRKALNYMGLKAEYISQPHERLLDKWFNEYKFKDEIVQKAADITILNLGKAEIPYMEAILADWYKYGVKTVKDIENLDTIKLNKKNNTASNNTYNKNAKSKNNSNFNNFKQRDYSNNDLESKLLGWNKKNE